MADLEIGEYAEGFWFGRWYPCKILKIRDAYLPGVEGVQEQYGKEREKVNQLMDVQWADGTETRKVPRLQLRKVTMRGSNEPVETDSPKGHREILVEDVPTTAVVVLPMGPPTLRVVALMFAWCSGIVYTALMFVTPPDESTVAFWISCGSILVSCVLFTLSELAARKLEKKLKKNAYEHPSSHRVNKLLLTKERTRAKTRHAMQDIVNTVREEAFNLIHNNPALSKVEACFKSSMHNNTADILLEGSESNVEWLTRWKPIGGTMHDSYGEPLKVCFGVNMRKLYFHLKSGYLNGSSYGATPKPVLEGQRQWATLVQKNPADWRFKALPLRKNQAEARIAEFINADPDDTALMVNANEATATILKSLPWQVGDRFMIFSCDYDATKLAGEFLERHHGVELYVMDVKLPISDIELCGQLHSVLKTMKDNHEPLPILANFCHVTSKTAYIFPATKLTQIFHAFGISVMIDGAQATGHLNVNCSEINADWYYGTVHKWMYSCPGVAFLITQPHKQRCTFPLTVSYFDGEGYNSEFAYQGLRDVSAWMSAIDGFDFVETVCGGWDAVRGYCHEQARRCVEILGELWGTKPFQQDQAHYGSLPIMPLPNGENHADQRDAVKTMGYLSVKHGITAFAVIVNISGTPTLCIRCTCQIYTQDSDWISLGNAVLNLEGNYSSLNVIKELSIPALLT
eukprot:TRINITY_DN5002_c2_g1_i2.p1 TRINITY_DN5002_c2_g1~~TRINITY_DN5002_c2_g1_i2.p1  ORF type:complete len:694 (+),score=85.10 TRINITY_DN5002_c2_g1_i2:23-2083(+)